jgi:hypothetical protein
MARLRTIKPEFWSDAAIGEVSVTARLLFIGTWNFADDHGGLDRSPKQLKAQVFPYDSIDCEPLIQELIGAGLLAEYEAGGKKYLHIKGFDKHQKVERKSLPRVPVYEDTLKTQRTLTESSPSPRGSSLGSCSLVSDQDRSGSERAPSAPQVIKSPAAEMAVAMRNLGVIVNVDHPTLRQWVIDGYTPQQVVDAANLARQRKPHPEPIPANYVDKILRAPPRAPPLSQHDRVTWRPEPDEATG